MIILQIKNLIIKKCLQATIFFNIRKAFIDASVELIFMNCLGRYSTLLQ